MLTDLEGVAGVVSFDQQAFSGARYYDEAKKLLTGEVNAAVEGLLEAGVSEVLVMDMHGPGGVWFEDLHPAARLLHGRPVAPWTRLQPIIAAHDAGIIIGQHAMAGTLTGNLSHTQSSRTVDSYRLNGHEIGETAQFALFCGALDVPIVFLSGDTDACREVERLIEGVGTMAVKQGVGRGCAISLSAGEARRRIREGVKEAIERQNRDPILPLQWMAPYVLEKRFYFVEDADASGAQPGAERVDERTVRFEADDILEIIYR
jgi:D-amino peptidase